MHGDIEWIQASVPIIGTSDAVVRRFTSSHCRSLSASASRLLSTSPAIKQARPKRFAISLADTDGGDSLHVALPEIPGGIAGPGLLAQTLVSHYLDHLPFHRQERIYGRRGLPFSPQTTDGWSLALMV